MRNMQEVLRAYIKKVFSDLHNVIVGILLLAALSGGGIYIFFQSLWLQLKSIMQSPTPLWATIALILLCCSYIHVRVCRKLEKLNQSGQSIESPPSQTKYYTIGDFIWEVEVHANGYFEVNQYPLCAKHSLRLIYGNYGKYCPEVLNKNCTNTLNKKDEFRTYESAKSIIENKIKNEQ